MSGMDVLCEVRVQAAAVDLDGLEPGIVELRHVPTVRQVHPPAPMVSNSRISFRQGRKGGVRLLCMCQGRKGGVRTCCCVCATCFRGRCSC